jgi:Uma2 family endonuclease
MITVSDKIDDARSHMNALSLDDPGLLNAESAHGDDARGRRPRKLSDWLDQFGNIPADRIRMVPPPGTATEADAIRVNYEDHSCELIDGTIVEVPVASRQDIFATMLASILIQFVRPRGLGLVAGPRVLYRMVGGNLREPDVGFTAIARVPIPYPDDAGPCPDLCVEILSPSNTRSELLRKRSEYFASGCRLVWEIEPRSGTVEIFTEAQTGTILPTDSILSGGDVLPGFAIPVVELLSTCGGMLFPNSPS